MTEIDIQVSDRTSVPPKADVRVATAVPPMAVATTNTPEASGTARKAPSDRLLGRSSRNDSSRLASNSVVEHSSSARQPSLGISSRDLPAASFGVAGLSARVSIKNVTTFAVAAASEIISNSVSTTSIPTT